MFGNWKGSYNLLALLLQAIVSTNSGTKFEQWNVPIWVPGVTNARQFKAKAWAFGPYIEVVLFI